MYIISAEIRERKMREWDIQINYNHEWDELSMITEYEFPTIDIRKCNINKVSYDWKLSMKITKSIWRWTKTWDKMHESECETMWQLYDNKKYIKRSKEKTWIWIERIRKMNEN